MDTGFSPVQPYKKEIQNSSASPGESPEAGDPAWHVATHTGKQRRFLLLKTHLSCGRINWLFPQSYSSSTKQAFCCRVTKSMGLELRIKRNWPEEHSLSEAPHSVLFWRHPFVPVRAKRRRELQLLPEYFQILKKYIFFPVIIWMFQINLGVILVQIVLIIIPILLYMNSQTLLKIQSKRKCCQ